MNYTPTPADAAVHVYLRKHGQQTAAQLTVLSTAAGDQYLYRILKRMTEGGYFVKKRGIIVNGRRWAVWVATDKPLPPVTRIAGGHRVAKERIGPALSLRPTVVHGGPVPKFIAPLTLSGLVQMQIGDRI